MCVADKALGGRAVAGAVAVWPRAGYYATQSAAILLDAARLSWILLNPVVHRRSADRADSEPRLQWYGPIRYLVCARSYWVPHRSSRHGVVERAASATAPLINPNDASTWGGDHFDMTPPADRTPTPCDESFGNPGRFTSSRRRGSLRRAPATCCVNKRASAHPDGLWLASPDQR